MQSILIALTLLLATPALAQETVVDIAVEDDSFTTLVAALETAGLVEVLQGDGPFTVFAPTDEAFGGLLGALNITAEDLLASEGLADILTYHVVPQALLAEDVLAAIEAGGGAAEVTTVNGASLIIEVIEGNVVINGAALVIATDFEADNGVVHVIDAVLLPPEEAAGEATITLGNVGASSWTIEAVTGEEGIAEVGAQNGTLTLTPGVRYTFDVSAVNSNAHPLDFRDASGAILLSQNASGSFQDDEAVDFVSSSDAVSFTLTPELAEAIASYHCTAHRSMVGSISIAGM